MQRHGVPVHELTLPQAADDERRRVPGDLRQFLLQAIEVLDRSDIVVGVMGHQQLL